MANSLTLLRQGHQLASASAQLTLLDKIEPTFATQLPSGELSSRSIEILQVNVGKLCNMTCDHCHVDAGPDRREIMQHDTALACVRALEANPSIETLDLTGGAPEMNPEFPFLVRRARELGRHVIDRSNLTILTTDRFSDLPNFLAEHQVEIVASLPCYLEENTDLQRGEGAFVQSIAALRKLNQLGYGTHRPDLRLTLVHNPVGCSLPSDQLQLERDYRRELRERYDVEFSRLFTIANLPVSRFLDHLLREGQFESYTEQLVEAYNPGTIDGLMCRNTISVGWDGRLYDCDFNQMLELSLRSQESASTIFSFDYDRLSHRPIHTRGHCYGCTAGAGSGCQGAIA